MTFFYYHFDGNKNVIAMTDANGAKVANYTYDAFGNVTSGTGSYAATNPFRFSSEYLDTETGLIYYNYRYCHPQFDRWLTRDTIGELGGVNLYAIVANNPINFFDLLGLKVISCFSSESGNMRSFLRDTATTLQAKIMMSLKIC